MQKDICTNHMITMKRFNLVFLLSILTGCALSPGMHMTENNNQAIYIDSLEKSIKIERLEDNLKDQVESSLYRIGNGDQIEVTVWGLPEIFPIRNISTDQNLRRVDSKGYIYFLMLA